jgi:pimeloyl-ACP methyl ester carboxylesterase
MPYANNQGVRIHYQVEGDGPPLVLLHGGLANLQMFYEIGYVEPLKKNYKLVLIDMRGYGASDKPHNPDAYELKPVTADILAVIDDLEINKAHTLLGSSMSGRIAFGVAKHASRRFKSFIIGSAHPYKPDQKALEEDEAALQAFKKGKDTVIEVLEKAGMKMTPERKTRLETNDYEAIAALFSATHWRLSLEDALPFMTMPCLVFAGEADPLHAGARKCAQNMPNGTFITLPGLGHFGVMAQMLPHITEFLARVT